jgi:cholesterol oxidase
VHDRGWLPKLGLKGILRLTIFKDIFVASGCGVGGGSLGYANTLYRARRASYSDRQWADLGDWEPELGPRYDEAERMLGVTTYDEDSEADLLLKADAQERGFGETYAKTRVRVFLGEPDTTVPDPYFGGEGPDRAGCIRCGSCMVGAAITPRTRWSRTTSTSPNVGGVEILPERTVVEIRPRVAAAGLRPPRAPRTHQQRTDPDRHRSG